MEKYVGKFKMETPQNFLKDEFVALRSNMYAFRSGDDSKKLERYLQISIKKNWRIL